MLTEPDSSLEHSFSLVLGQQHQLTLPTSSDSLSETLPLAYQVQSNFLFAKTSHLIN